MLHASRIAVFIFFFVNGFLHANLMARLPLFQADLRLSNSILGTLLFTVAIGALVGMPVAGSLAKRYGSGRMATWTAVFFCLCVPLIPLATNVGIAAVLFFVMGMSMGAMDVCMNGQAVFVEQRWQKPIMSSFHAAFSIGVACGAGAGSLASSFNVGLPIHIALASLLCLAAIIWASGQLVEDPGRSESESQKKKAFSLPPQAILPLGLIAFCCMTGEGSMTDWSAIYMSKIVGKDGAFAAIAFGIYASGMTLGRLFGDHFTQKLGRRKLMVYDSLLALTGLGIALSYVSVATTLIGFFLVGLGVATVVPIVFSTAGNTKGVHPSQGIAMVTSIGYAGFFIGPPAIGFLSDASSLRVGLGFSMLLFGLMFFLVLRFVKITDR